MTSRQYPEYHKRWHEANPGKRAEYARRWREKNPGAAREQWLRRRYGITVAEYESMFDKQGGTCAICGLAEYALDRSGKPKPLSVDHDHETGQVRGLLCHNCNVALGHLKENTDLLNRIAFYLVAA